MKVLIVDDNSNDRRVLRYTVEAHGHEAIEAGNGWEGLQMACTHGPGLIISDVLMPGMDGFQFLRHLKRETTAKAIPFIFYSAVYDESEDMQFAFSLGADAYIIKPTAPGELWAEIERIIGQKETKIAVTSELVEDESEYLKKYVQVVANKLDEKVRQLEETLAVRKQAEEALREQYSILRSIIDSANALIFSVDRHYRYTSFNKGHAAVMQAIYGVELQVGHSLLDYITVTEDRETAKRNLDRALAGEQLVEEAYSGEELRTQRYFHVSHSPIKTESGDVIGVAVLAHDMTEHKRADEVLQANQRKLSDMAVKLSLAEERERRRVATELHDRIGQTLLLGKMRFDALVKELGTMAPEGMVDDIRLLLNDAINDVRSLTQELHPPMLTGAGLGPALEWLGRRMETDYGLRVEFVDDKSAKPLTEELRSVVYMAARELLINVAKHADTDSARIIFGRDGQMLKLVIEDRGIGFDIPANSAKRAGEIGYGHFSIRERITYLGGEMAVESTPGQGTCVTLRVPLKVDELQSNTKKRYSVNSSFV